MNSGARHRRPPCPDAPPATASESSGGRGAPRPTREDVSLLARFRDAVRRAGVPDGASLLVAVSGGSDSVALLELTMREAQRRGWRVRAAHLDHGLRPASNEDARFVRELCRARGVASTGLRVRPGAWDRPEGSVGEAEARRMRRRALRLLARRYGADRILLGHTRDDQVETILLHLLRGTGIRGLAGMDLRRGVWVRPLLDVGRADLRDFLERRGRSWREDPSNADHRFLRNRLRHLLLPLLEEQIRPGATRALLRLGESLRPVRARQREELRDAWNRLSPRRTDGGIRLDRAILATYDPELVEGILQRAFRALCRSPEHLGQAHVRALDRAVRDTVPRQFDLPAGARASVNAREIRLVLAAGPGQSRARPRPTR